MGNYLYLIAAHLRNNLSLYFGTMTVALLPRYFSYQVMEVSDELQCSIISQHQIPLWLVYCALQAEHSLHSIDNSLLNTSMVECFVKRQCRIQISYIRWHTSLASDEVYAHNGCFGTSHNDTFPKSSLIVLIFSTRYTLTVSYENNQNGLISISALQNGLQRATTIFCIGTVSLWLVTRVTYAYVTEVCLGR